MAAAKTLEDIITEQAPIVCEQIEAAVAFADSEEDLRIECEKAIEVFRKEADLPELKGHHEVTIGKGRADSVYDYVFIEYKKPGRLKESNDTPGNRDVIKQLQERAKAFKSELKRDPKELFGVGTDGNYFITARYRSGRWEISPARERSVHVVEDFLRKLSSLGVAGKPFLADYLAGDFGAESERKLAREGIEKLYWRIREVEKKPEDYPKAKVLFDQWRILFGEVCGYDIKSPSSKIKQLGEFYGVKKDPNAAALLFAVHSYYALFMKFLAAEIATMFNPLSASFLASLHQAGSSEKLIEKLRELEDGGIYHHLGIKNFLEGDLFSWYLDAWDDNVEQIIRQMVACLDEYDPKTLSIDPVESRDLLKKLYQQLFPKTVRHDLGEYYTPDWLAELVIEQVGYDGDPDKRVLDPACGSGTFLVMAINKVREYADKHLIPKHELLPKILNNIVGFDLNPLAVMAARTNYLLALRELLKLGGEIEIPVYLCDSIMTPAEYGELLTKEGTATGGIGKVQELKTSAARFMIPTEIAQNRQTVAKYTEELEHCVRNDYTEDEFISRVKGESIPVGSEELHKGLYQQVLKLKKQNKNDIWARIIKNSFAPLFTERVDYIVGNPPWVNYENLPADYRGASAIVWERYGLFPKGGWRARFAKGNTELAMVFTYVAMDAFLVRHGKLGFVCTQSVFQSKDAGRGFRTFSLPENSRGIEVANVEDFTEVQPFEGATNRTAVFVAAISSSGTSYPVPYTKWIIKRGCRIDASDTLSEVQNKTKRARKHAFPIGDRQSPWMVLPIGVSKRSADLLLQGQQVYRAWKGADTRGGNGIFWLKILGRKSGLITARNTPEFSTRKTEKPPPKEWVFEEGLIYPLLRGRETERWSTSPECSLIFPHRGDSAIPERELKQSWPKTFAYFKEMEPYLRKRKMFDLSRRELPFYSLFETGDFLLAPFKVVWKYVASELTCAVQRPLSDGKSSIVIPDHKLVIVPFYEEHEAYYVCGTLNSSVARFIANTYVVSTQISTHILNYIKVPKFNAKNPLHSRVSKASRQAHQLKAAGKAEELAEVEKQLDALAAELWGITPKELEQMQKALNED